MALFLIPGSVGNENKEKDLFDSMFARTSSEASLSCISAGLVHENSNSHNYFLFEKNKAFSPIDNIDAPRSNLSGSYWVKTYDSNVYLDKLKSPFKESVKKFIDSLKYSGAGVCILSEDVSDEKKYLMYYSWNIANQIIAPDAVPSMPGLYINWDHGDLEKSINAAKDMVYGFKMTNPPSLDKKEIDGNFIEMDILNYMNKSFFNKNKFLFKVNNNEDLYSLASSYGIYKDKSNKFGWSNKQKN